MKSSTKNKQKKDRMEYNKQLNIYINTVDFI